MHAQADATAGGAEAVSRSTLQGAARPKQAASTVSIEEDPAAVAVQWRPGKTLRIWSAEPENDAVRDWVARLWAAMPAESRPAAPYTVQRDSALARGQLRIEREE